MKKKHRKAPALIEVCHFIISDLHLGSENCRAKRLLRTLKRFKFKVLIIVGDLVEDVHPAALKPSHWKLLRYIRKMKVRGVKIIRIRGNHDCRRKDFVNKFLKVKSCDQTSLEFANGQRIGFTHGDQWDEYTARKGFWNTVVTRFSLGLQKFGAFGRTFSRWLDDKHGWWCRLTDAVAEGAIEYAIEKKWRKIVCGHTHKQIHCIHQEDDCRVDYYNCGDWTGRHCSFLTMNEEGEITLWILRGRKVVMVAQRCV